MTDELRPARSAKRCGRMPSQESAERFAPRGTIFGRPRRSSEKPARRTSTTTRLLPVFVTRMVAAPDPVSVRWAGDAVSATGDRVMAAPAVAGTTMRRTRTLRATRLIDR
ncbi:MAG: hypothetical protein E6G20_12285 [Actinobacteria bacterium]|nr:MAG: hypothetical protein E6G20_12285 [Actinomycetota bacterium]